MDTKIIKDVEKFENIPDLEKAITFFGSARLKEDNFYYQQAKILAQKCAQNGFCVISGGGGGIMRAANEGAFSQKNNTNSMSSVGFNIFLPHEQKLNDFVEYNITFESLAIRKMALIEKSLAFVIFPGGFGTLDELCEILTLKQLEFKKDVPIILFGSEFWRGFDEFVRNSLLKLEVISKGDEL
ncbi:TIGR00730 family Rossman fold protein, partial [Campylobacter jejuni]|nr:TIGR00730 family Rossman fold protein [Campylobacter jejuni]